MKKRIYINRFALKRGDPPVSMRTSKGTAHGYAARIDGPSIVCYDRTKCPRVWIETTAHVTLL